MSGIDEKDVPGMDGDAPGRSSPKLFQLLFALLLLEGVTASVLILASVFAGGLEGVYPYGSFRTSVLELVVVVSLLSKAGIYLLPRGSWKRDEDLESSAPRATWIWRGHLAALGLAFVKLSSLAWTGMDGRSAAACGSIIACLSALAAAIMNLVSMAHAAYEREAAASGLYDRIYASDAEDGVELDEDGDEKKAQLSLAQILKTLKPYFWPRSLIGRLYVMLTWVFVLGSKAAGVIAPFFISTAADAVNRGDTRRAAQDIGIFGTLLFLSKTLKEGQSLAYLRVAQAAFVDLAEDAFRHVHSLSIHWALKKKLGEVVRVTDRGIAACDTLMRYGVLYLGPAALETVAVCVLFLTYFDYWPLALVCFVSVGVYAVITVKLTLWRKKFRSAMNRADNEWHDKLTDSLVNFETVKYFTNEEFEATRFLGAVGKYQANNVDVLFSLSVLNITQQAILNGCLIGALILSGLAIKDGDMSIGDFLAVSTWVSNLFVPLNFLGTVYNALVTAMVDIKNLSQLFAERPDVEDAPHATALPRADAYELSFEGVSFAYKENGRGVRGVSFRVPPGTTTAIVGHTGSGKTTVSRLVFRFYDPNEGSVRVNGSDVRDHTQRSLRARMGVVPQDTVLFNDTIRHNVAYGDLGATQAQLEDAARSAQILDFIEALPDGWDTVVGERGLKLSGGEKQRVALARCLLKDPPIVLFDEATSALDSRTEKSVQDALSALGKNRTCVIIAHRLSTIQHADQILVLDEGRIVERGSHAELIAKQGEYFDLWQTQKMHGEESKEG